MTGGMRVGVAGSGMLHDAAVALLSPEHRVRRLDPANRDERSVDVLVLVHDGWDREQHRVWNDWCLDNEVSLLPAYVVPGAALVGPVLSAVDDGCLVCVEGRRLRARNDVGDFGKALDAEPSRMAAMGAAWLTALACDLVATLIGREVDRIAAGADPGPMIRVALDSLRTSTHHWLPDPLCERCGRLPEDSREAAVVELVPRPKVAPDVYRVRSLAGEQDRLHRVYVDREAGLLRAVYKEGRSVFPSASSPMGLRATTRTEVGYGHQTNFAASQLTAIAEGVERYGGIEPGGKRTVVRSSYRELGGDALDPTVLGLHADELYDRPGFPYPRYHHDMVFNWVWGWSLGQRRAILVPENYAYYGTVYRNTRDHPFVYEISNGCALGGCLEEAILYGILEVAERDAFLMTWYARLPAPRIDVRSAPDPSIPLIVGSIESFSGYSIEAFDITVEQGIPAFWVMAVNRRGMPDMPQVLCASGSHLDPVKALRNALMELGPLVSRPAEFHRQQRPRVERMLADPYEVVSMEDHAALNGAPEVFDRFDFLLGSPGRQTFQEAFADYYRRPRHTDLTRDLTDTVERYRRSGLDVIAVDQTTPEHRAGDFRCVKVIIPGCLPMTFGHARRRDRGFARLYRVPQELGYYDRPLTDADINPHPHPFP
ncbi:TOMM precursor leader peptide-binding protein [Couchioplanes azureus]|uniref:TOMM precursor leader peptide-binding protein n=1 Tax=Couchioplanes caeruleus TaxID=56438 RepID=UPI0016701466|nr:TOMM precursor leader peptide-binding protein [Couchioplanes caeruleus]GGQ66822.1 SagD family biosynthesis docking scaffold protein [Couchioplanes caeruleus subsp. azureus]